jgi:hypothetical protein
VGTDLEVKDQIQQLALARRLINLSYLTFLASFGLFVLGCEDKGYAKMWWVLSFMLIIMVMCLISTAKHVMYKAMGLKE